MDSAQSQVQQMRYAATFPLLLNIADQPTYFMALKGADGLVKMYAMVNVQQYDIVSTGATVADCEGSYRQTLASRGLIPQDLANPAEGGARADEIEGESVVTEIRSSVIGGDTHYYVKLADVPAYLDFSAADAPTAVLLNVGDRIRYRCGAFPDNIRRDALIPASWFAFADDSGETPPELPAATPSEETSDMATPATQENVTPSNDAAQETDSASESQDGANAAQ